MIVPPRKLRLSVNSLTTLEKILLIKTPKIENTTANPKTKNTVFSTMFNRLIVRTDPLLEPSSVTVVPDMYARKAGIIGRMHGAINEPRPASIATNIVGSAMCSIYNFSFKAFFHIFSKSQYKPFLSGMDRIFGMNKRFIIVGVLLGIVVTFAVIIGSPALGGFDTLR